eukprot:scaffold247538_cov32-Tisochrysis_lutea.AAC.1
MALGLERVVRWLLKGWFGMERHNVRPANPARAHTRPLLSLPASLCGANQTGRPHLLTCRAAYRAGAPLCDTPRAARARTGNRHLQSPSCHRGDTAGTRLYILRARRNAVGVAAAKWLARGDSWAPVDTEVATSSLHQLQ